MGETYYYDDTMAIGVAIFVIVLYFAVIGISIATYVMQGVGLFQLGRKQKIRNPWLAWIPLGNLWALGAIVDSFAARNGIKRNWRWLMVAFYGIAIISYMLLFGVMYGSAFMMEMQGGEPDLSALWGTFGGVFGAYFLLFIGLLLLQVSSIVCMYKIFEETVPEKAVKYLLLSVIVPLAYGFCLIRSAKQVMPAAEAEMLALPEDGSGFISQDPFAGLGGNENK